MARSSADPVRVPAKYPTAAMFIDESGSRASANEFFVVAALKVRQPGQLAREVQAVRERYQYFKEFKFVDITKGAVPMYGDVISALEDSDATIAACVVSGSVCDPFRGNRDTWRVHADITTQATGWLRW